MDILKAIDAADKTGCSCIRRTMGMMKSRTLQFESPHGILMTENYSPVSGMSPVKPRYALDLDDLCATTWDMAPGIKLIYAGPEPTQKADAADKIAAAIAALAGEIADAAPGADADDAGKIGSLANAANNLACTRYNLALAQRTAAKTAAINLRKEPDDQNDSQQENGQ